MAQNQATATSSKPKRSARLLHWLPGVRWVPEDMPSEDTMAGAEASTSGSKRKDLTETGDQAGRRGSSSSSLRNHRVSFSIREKRNSLVHRRSKDDRRGSTLSESTPDEQDNDPRFPLHKRKRTISISRMQSEEEISARTCLQEQSPFFAQLPIEIRKLVYEFVVGEGQIVHLTLGVKRRFGHFVCEKPASGHGDVNGDCSCKVFVGGKNSKRLDASALNLIRCCRRIYTEALPHVYIPHTFSLLHLTHLLYLPTRIPIPRLNTIRTLRLRYSIRALPFISRANDRASSSRYTYPEDTANWIRCWKILSNMRELRDLVVVLSDPSPNQIWEEAWLSLEERLLEAVTRVRIKGRSEVWLPYASCRLDWDMGELGVVLKKPSDGKEGEG